MGHQQRGCSSEASGPVIGRSSFQGFPTPGSQWWQQIHTAQEEPFLFLPVLSGNFMGGDQKADAVRANQAAIKPGRL